MIGTSADPTSKRSLTVFGTEAYTITQSRTVQLLNGYNLIVAGKNFTTVAAGVDIWQEATGAGNITITTPNIVTVVGTNKIDLNPLL